MRKCVSYGPMRWNALRRMKVPWCAKPVFSFIQTLGPRGQRSRARPGSPTQPGSPRYRPSWRATQHAPWPGRAGRSTRTSACRNSSLPRSRAAHPGSWRRRSRHLARTANRPTRPRAGQRRRACRRSTRRRPARVRRRPAPPAHTGQAALDAVDPIEHGGDHEYVRHGPGRRLARTCRPAALVCFTQRQSGAGRASGRAGNASTCSCSNAELPGHAATRLRPPGPAHPAPPPTGRSCHVALRAGATLGHACGSAPVASIRGHVHACTPALAAHACGRTPGLAATRAEGAGPPIAPAYRHRSLGHPFRGLGVDRPGCAGPGRPGLLGGDAPARIARRDPGGTCLGASRPGMRLALP